MKGLAGLSSICLKYSPKSVPEYLPLFQVRCCDSKRRGEDSHQRLHLLQAEGPQCGCASIALLQPQVRVCGPLQHRHLAPHQYPQDHAGEGHQGEHQVQGGGDVRIRFTNIKMAWTEKHNCLVQPARNMR